MTEIVAFGDSIVYGAEDKDGGWVQRLRKFLDKVQFSKEGAYFATFNLGVGSNTSEDLLRRFENELRERRLSENLKADDLVLIFEVGTNDLVKRGSDSNPCNVEPDRFAKNISELITKAKGNTDKILFLGVLPVIEEKTNPARFEINVYLNNKRAEEYNSIVKQACKQEKVEFIDLFKIFTKMKNGYEDMLYEDGGHPNSNGHKKIFSLVKARLIKKNWIAV